MDEVTFYRWVQWRGPIAAVILGTALVIGNCGYQVGQTNRACIEATGNKDCDKPYTEQQAEHDRRINAFKTCTDRLDSTTLTSEEYNDAVDGTCVPLLDGAPPPESLR